MNRKVKYDYAFKLECVQLVISHHYSTESVSKQKGISESNIRRWVDFYRKFGTSGLLSRKKQFYSTDYKLNVIRSIEHQSLSIREACLKFNIPSDSIIIRWQRDFINLGLDGLKPKTKGRPLSMSNIKRKKRKSDKPLTREEELLQEIEILRCENDLLKKFHALIQAEEKNKRHKP